MCALFGWLDYKGIVLDKLLKKLTQALANAAEERGTDASGIAYVKATRLLSTKDRNLPTRFALTHPTVQGQSWDILA